MSKRKAKKRPKQPRRPARGDGKAILRFLRRIPWHNPRIVAGVLVAVVAGLFAIVLQVMKPNPVADNEPIVKFGLDEQGVGREVGKAIGPLTQAVNSVHDAVKALDRKLAMVQLAPKQPVSDSGDRLKNRAVEFFNAGVDAYNKGEIGQAFGHYFAAVHLYPEDAAAHNNLGIALLERGEPQEAATSFRAAVRLRPERARYHNNLGTAQARSDDLDGAASSFDKAIDLEDTFAEAHVNRGLLHERFGEDVNAKREYRIAIELNDRLWEPRIALGNLLQKEGLLADARHQFRRVLELDPGNYSAHYNIGNAFFDQAQWVMATSPEAAEELWLDAIRAYENAIDLKPDHSGALNGLGACFLERGDPASAVGYFKRALTGDPSNAPAMFNLAEALMAWENAGKEEYAEAVEQLRTAITLDPDSRTLYLARLGRALLEIGDVDGAVYFLVLSSRALADNPLLTEAEQAQAQFALARAFARQGRAGEATDALRRALSLEPSLRDNIRGCTDFDKIRARPEFRALVD